MSFLRNQASKIKVEIYSKSDCHLCQEAKETLVRVQKSSPFELVEVDITQDENLFERYKEKIPVVFINGRIAFKYRINEQALRKRLMRAG